MKKRNKNSLLKKIIVVLVELLIVINVLKYSENFKKNITYSAIIDNSNILLSQKIYFDDDITYMSFDDIKKYIDPEIYIEKINNTETIVTTGFNSILTISENNKNIEINGVSKTIKSGAIKKDGKYYLPISEMLDIYNIEIEKYNDIIDIEYLSKEKTVGYINKDTKLKYKDNAVSQDVGELKTGDYIIIIEKLENDWSKIKTENGNIGYVKTKNISNETQLRQNIDFSSYSKIDINSENVRELTDVDIEKINGSFENYNARKDLINKIVESSVENELKGVNVKFSTINNLENYYRFLIELRPYLNNYGISLIVTKTDKTDENRLKQIANIVV